MVLLAICGAHYNFTAIVIGEYGSNNDSGVSLNSRIGMDLMKWYHSFVADQIFSLKEWLMCPLAVKQLTDKMRKVFNYRLS